MTDNVQRPDECSIGSITASADGVLTIGGVRSVMLTRQAFIYFIRVLHEHAPHVVRYALYDIGYRTGENLVRVLGNGQEKQFVNLVEAYKQSGYGDLEVTEFDPDSRRAKLVGRNLFESDLAKDAGIFRTPRAVDFYSCGMFAGFMSELFGQEVVCQELKCEFRGDPYCEFIALPLED